MTRVKMDAKMEYQYIANFKILQTAFKQHKIDKPILVEKLVKCKMQYVFFSPLRDNYVFIRVAGTTSNFCSGSSVSGIPTTGDMLMTQSRAAKELHSNSPPPSPPLPQAQQHVEPLGPRRLELVAVPHSVATVQEVPSQRSSSNCRLKYATSAVTSKDWRRNATFTLRS